MAVMVNVDNFARAETHRTFADLQRDAGGVGVFRHVTPQGWNYLVRLYRPRAEFFDGIWTVPSLTSISGSKGA